jgi:hypothetical protein
VTRHILAQFGTIQWTLIGDIPHFGSIWYNPASIAKILSLVAVKKACRITIDTDLELAFLVHKKDGVIMKFLEYHSELYYHNTLINKLTLSTKVLQLRFY